MEVEEKVLHTIWKIGSRREEENRKRGFTFVFYFSTAFFSFFPLSIPLASPLLPPSPSSLYTHPKTQALIAPLNFNPFFRSLSPSPSPSLSPFLVPRRNGAAQLSAAEIHHRMQEIVKERNSRKKERKNSCVLCHCSQKPQVFWRFRTGSGADGGGE